MNDCWPPHGGRLITRGPIDAQFAEQPGLRAVNILQAAQMTHTAASRTQARRSAWLSGADEGRRAAVGCG
jgi:hypothetical protein